MHILYVYNDVQTCAAIEEELVFLSAPSRLDYFKAGIQVNYSVSFSINDYQ